MGEQSDATPDPTDPERRSLGEGLFEEEMGPSSAMAHLYRGEIHRMKLWRERLDRTTNWAVIVLTAVLTWAFSEPSNPHYVILVGGAALTIFLVIEARRFRGYEIWRSRVRTIQGNVIAPGLDPTRSLPNPEWRRDLATDYADPAVKITAEEAIAHRLRRVYLPLFGVLLAAWVVRVTAFVDQPWPESASVGPIPGVVVAATVGAYLLCLAAVALRPRNWHAREEMRRERLRKER